MSQNLPSLLWSFNRSIKITFFTCVQNVIFPRIMRDIISNTKVVKFWLRQISFFFCECKYVSNDHSFLLEDGLHGIVSCTACGQQVNHFQKDSIYRHPSLKVLICKVCKDLVIRLCPLEGSQCVRIPDV